MKTKHTKGEWVLDLHHRYSTQGTLRVEGSYTNSVANIEFHARDNSNEKLNHEEILANAKLIASAPELLKALVKLYNSIDSCIDLTPDVLREASEAIRKATGNNFNTPSHE